MKPFEIFKGLLLNKIEIYQSDTGENMLTSCSCPHVSMKANTEEINSSKKSHVRDSDLCSVEDNDNTENEFVFVFKDEPQSDIGNISNPRSIYSSLSSRNKSLNNYLACENKATTSDCLIKKSNDLQFENVCNSFEECSIGSSIRSNDSSLLTTSSFDSNEIKSSRSDSEYQSCDPGINNRNSVKSYDSLLPSSDFASDKNIPYESKNNSCPEINQTQSSPKTQTSHLSLVPDAHVIEYSENTPLPYFEIPGMALSVSSRTQLSLHLNVPLTLGNDWKMLGGEFGFEYLELENFSIQKDPAGSMINQWCTKADSTFKTLLNALAFIDRQDVIDSVKKFIERDAETWRKKKEREANPYQQIPILQIAASNYPNIPEIPENRGITLHDHPSGPIETFDAFVCFTVDDRKFVFEMMSNLEKPPFNMKLCVDFRDIVPGAAWMTSSAELIGKRCKRMIVVLSPKFTKSPECDFQAKFALSLTPGNRTKRIVPIMYEMCSVPEILRFISVCDYTKEDLRPFFWERLSVALALN